MNRIVIFIIILLAHMLIGDGESLAFYYGDIGPPGPNEVHIAQVVIEIPLGKILLVRKDSDYCAIRFSEFWTDKTGEEFYSIYESYYQGDKTGDFNKKNVQVQKAKLSASKLYGIGRLSFRFGEHNIRCGPIKLSWFGKGSVFFYSSNQDEGDYGIELAPTIWTDIAEVNVFDPRVKWYRYDEKRKRVNISADQLWDDTNTFPHKEEGK